MVPERATKFFTESPWLAKFVLRSVKLRKGAGMELLASALLAAIESLLPKPTSHDGPPSCKFQHILPHQ